MSALKVISLSVTQLANFACRTGDLMPDAVTGPTARQGMQAHKKLQAQRMELAPSESRVQAEYSLSGEYTVDEYTIRLGGRIDLVDLQNNELTEIKTTLVPADRVPESQRSVQWAQLLLYGYLYYQVLLSGSDNRAAQLSEECETQTSTDCESGDNKVEQGILNLELVHVNLLASTVTSDIRRMSAVELVDHAHQAMQGYIQWLRQVHRWRQRLEQCTAALEFPFKRFRQGQRDMAVAVYRASRNSKALMCEAPTGIGKTISALYPALKSMSDGGVQQLVFLTAKVAGRHSVEQAIEKLVVNGLQTTMIQIRAKEQTCFCSNGRCERDDSARCPMTLGFFDRLPEARDELLSLGIISNEQLDAIAWEHQLCPFELVQQLLPWVQIVVADYNYVYDPLVRLAHFSVPQPDTLLLIDEAHNLLDRSRWMYSAQLSRLQCMDAATESRVHHPLLAAGLDSLSRSMLSFAAASAQEGVDIVTDLPARVSRAVSKVLECSTLSVSEPVVLGVKSAAVWRDLCRYSVISDLFSAYHRCIVRRRVIGRRSEVVVVLFCVDAAKALEVTHRQYKCPVMFSATLRPETFYRQTLGLSEDTSYLQIGSPFHANQCFHAVVDWIDTRYRYRQQSMSKLVSLIYETTSTKSGSYLVFLPSYTYLEQTYSLFVATYPNCRTWAQSREQSRQERQMLLDELQNPGHRVGFAIVGGVFGEGIDYRGDQLIGALIVGTGLPGFDKQSELVADHYRDAGRDGYDFTYRYPGFTRVLQTAGRVIRDESDKGFVLLVDSRFGHRRYTELFPEDWLLRYPVNQMKLVQSLDRFWET